MVPLSFHHPPSMSSPPFGSTHDGKFPNLLLATITYQFAVFMTLEDARRKTKALRARVDQRVGIFDDNAMELSTGKTGEERLEQLEREAVDFKKRIGDLEDYAKVTTCAFQDLIAVNRSLQHAGDKVCIFFEINSNILTSTNFAVFPPRRHERCSSSLGRWPLSRSVRLGYSLAVPIRRVQADPPVGSHWRRVPQLDALHLPAQRRLPHLPRERSQQQEAPLFPVPVITICL